MKQPLNLTIRAFRAIDEPETTRNTNQKYIDTLRRIGVVDAFEMTPEWMHDPYSIQVIAEHSKLGIVGGVRLQMSRSNNPLMMYTSIEKMDGAIIPIFHEWERLGLAELCGLWVSPMVKGNHLAQHMAVAGVAACKQIPIRKLVLFAAAYTVQFALNCGFSVMHRVGEKGSFQFPNKDIRSFAMVLKDPQSCLDAPLGFRKTILDLRENPEQLLWHGNRKTPLLIQYAVHTEQRTAEPARTREFVFRPRLSAG